MALLLVAVVAACGAGPNAVLGQPSPSTSSAVPSSSVAPRLVAVAMSIKDKKGDLVDEAGDPVTKNDHIDIVKLTAAADGSSLRLALDLAGVVPAALSSKDQQVTYLFELEKDRSGAFDYWIVISNLENGSWSASITDYTEAGHGGSAYGSRFPGSSVVDGKSVQVTVALEAIGNPSRLRIAAAAQRADQVSGVVLAQDHAPKDTTKPSKAWLALGP